MPEVSLKIGAFIEGLEKGLNKAKGKLAQFTSWVQRNQAKLKKIRLGGAAVLTGGILIMRDLTKAYGVQEQAEIGLLQAMKNAGIYTAERFEQTKAYAAELQKLSNFGDEEIIQAQALLIAVGKLSGEGLERATQATLDLAAAKKMDLRSAADLVSKSIGSTTNALSRYSIEIDNTLTGTERAEAITREIAELFGGQAKVASETMTGKLKQMSMAWGDLKEDLGEAILPMLVKLAEYLSEIIPKIAKWVQANQKLVAVLAGGGIGGAGLILVLSQFALAFTNPVTGIIAVVAAAAIGVYKLIKWLKSLRKEVSDLPDSLSAVNAEIKETKEQIAALEKKSKEKGAGIGFWEAIGLGRGAQSGPGSEAGKTQVTKNLEELEKVQKRLEALIELKKEMLTAAIPEKPEELEHPEVSIPGIPTEDDIEVAEENMEHLLEIQEDYYDALEDMSQKDLDRIAAEQQRKTAIYEDMGFAMLSIFSSTFEAVLQEEGKFGANLVIAAIESMVQMLQAVIDAAVYEIMADQIKMTAKLLMMGAIDWSAFAKIALVAAAAGAGKASLGALAGKARGSLMSSVPAYEYGGVVPETGLAMVHKGEHYFNPNYPEESLRNMGGGINFTFQNYGDLDSRKRLHEAFENFEERLISRRMAGRLSR